jgi:1-acyl-sn-glycerol-3-phosphate acyltransferase
MADIIAVYLLGANFKWLAKSELFKVPFFGWSMALCGYIPLERGSIKSMGASLERARQYLKKGVPILIFPEGTRSETGELREFKGGAFKLALEEKVPIVPIAMTGTRHILQKGDWKLADSVFVQIEVLPAVAPQGDEKDLRHTVREQIKEGLLRLKNERH